MTHPSQIDCSLGWCRVRRGESIVGNTFHLWDGDVCNPATECGLRVEGRDLRDFLPSVSDFPEATACRKCLSAARRHGYDPTPKMEAHR